MIGLFLFTFTLGAILVGASLLTGGDAEVGADAPDLDAGGGDASTDLAETGGSPWLPFLSLRFWSFGLAAFGATGLLVSLGEAAPWVVLLAAVAGGVGGGTSAAWLFRQLGRDTVTGDTSLGRYVGEQATVVLPIRDGRTGQIRIETAGGDLVLPAMSRDRKDLGIGTRVLIAAFDGRTADVTGITVLESGDAHLP